MMEVQCAFSPNAKLTAPALPDASCPAVPGIDMANHVFEPNAGVQIRHSPAYCQGLSAIEDVCEPPPPEPSQFMLVAGPAGIR